MTLFDALVKIWCCAAKGNPDGIVIGLVEVRVTDPSHDNGVVMGDEDVVASAILGWFCSLVPGVSFVVCLLEKGDGILKIMLGNESREVYVTGGGGAGQMYVEIAQKYNGYPQVLINDL